MPLHEKHCVPCEGKVPPLSTNEEERLLNEIHWDISREGVHRIRKTYKFKDFKEAMEFVNRVAQVAEEENHHPNLSISYNRVSVELYTHAVEGLSENDFIMAAKIDHLLQPATAQHH